MFYSCAFETKMYLPGMQKAKTVLIGRQKDEDE